MEDQPSVPNVSIPCHNEQRDKKKRYTVSVLGHSYLLGRKINCRTLDLTLSFVFTSSVFVVGGFLGLQSDGHCWTTGMVCLQAICRV